MNTTILSLIILLSKHEGLRLHSYDDATGKRISTFKNLKGNPTIGIGHLIKPNEIKYLLEPLTEHEAYKLLIDDIKAHENIARNVFQNFNSLSHNKKVFAIAMAFNLGNKLRTFKKANKLFNEFKFKESIKEYKDSKWSTQISSTRLTDMMNLLKS